MSTNLEAIRKAAEAATPGKWNWWTSCSWRRLHSEQAGGQQVPVLMPTVASDGHPDLMVSVEDREFIAMANPATVLELCRRAERQEWPSEAPVTVEVFYVEGEASLVCGFSGPTGLLEELESEVEMLLTECPEIFSKGDGIYLFRASYNTAQVDYLGRTEIPAYFDLDEIGFKHHDQEQPERYSVLSGESK